MEFSEEEWSALIQRLRTLADGDHVVWHSADGIGGEPFTTTVPSGTKFEVSTVDSDGMFPYRVRVVEEGVVVLEFVSPPSDRRSPHGDRASADLHALYKSLARDLSGAKKKFDALIGELDGLA